MKVNFNTECKDKGEGEYWIEKRRDKYEDKVNVKDRNKDKV